MRHPVIGVSDQVIYKPGCTVTIDSQMPEISDLEKKRDCIIHKPDCTVFEMMH